MLFIDGAVFGAMFATVAVVAVLRYVVRDDCPDEQ